jgi:hypothetical protein
MPGGSDKAAQAAVTGRSDDQEVGLASGVPVDHRNMADVADAAAGRLDRVFMAAGVCASEDQSWPAEGG